MGTNFANVLNAITKTKEILDIPIYEGGTDFPQKHDIELRKQGVSVEDVAAYAESLMPDWGGVGRYPVKAGRATGWVHVDTRAEKARWRG